MLKSLLKYDMQPMKRLWKALLPATIVAAVLSAIALRIGFKMIEADANAVTVSEIIAPFIIMIGVLGSMAVCATYVINLFFLARRFSSSFYSDEAYLTFMLPVKREKLLLSKLLNALIWNGLMAALLLVCVFIYLLIVPTSEEGGLISFDLIKTVFWAIGSGFREETLLSSFCILLIPIIILETFALEVIILHYCISITRSIAGIALWLVANSVIGTVGSVAFTFGILGLVEIVISPAAETAVLLLLLFGTVIALFAIGLVFYLKTQDNLKFKLNVW